MSEHKLELNRSFNVGVERIYEAWTNPEIMFNWMGPGTVHCEKVDIDLKVGGTFRIQMTSEEGAHIATGQYHLIEPNKQLQFSWSWENIEMGETQVTLFFSGDDSQSELTLLHEHFPNEEFATKHTHGWGGCLDKLEQHLAVDV